MVSIGQIARRNTRLCMTPSEGDPDASHHLPTAIDRQPDKGGYSDEEKQAVPMEVSACVKVVK